MDSIDNLAARAATAVRMADGQRAQAHDTLLESPTSGSYWALVILNAMSLQNEAISCLSQALDQMKPPTTD